MANLRVSVTGFAEMAATLRELGPATERRVIVPALTAMARVVRREARQRNFGFRDRTGALRRSIRTRQAKARIGGRTFARGRAVLFAGNRDAAQAYLVEKGHGGPQPAPPHPFLTRALVRTQDAQLMAFTTKARERFPLAVASAMRRSRLTRTRISVGARTVARRGRRG